MNSRPEHYEELLQLISSLLDDSISVEEMRRLETLLENDPAARRLYYQMVDQEIELSALPSLPALEPTPQFRFSRRPRRRRPAPAGPRALALAAIFVVAIGLLALFAPKNEHSSKDRPASVGRVPEREGAPAIGYWSEDFESGSIGGWTGRLLTNDVEAGGRYGLGSVPFQYADTVFHVIKLPEDWREGFCSFTDRSVLRLRYRVDGDPGLNVFLHTLPFDSAAADFGMFQLRADDFPGALGRWHTVSLNFSNFVRKVVVEPGGQLEFAGGPPRVGERPATLVFSGPTNLTLVIDRIEIGPVTDILPPEESPSRTSWPNNKDTP